MKGASGARGAVWEAKGSNDTWASLLDEEAKSERVVAPEPPMKSDQSLSGAVTRPEDVDAIDDVCEICGGAARLVAERVR